jgi:hypothetical protein
MKYLLVAGLTFCITSYILYKGRKTKPFPKLVYSQSNIHMMIKDFLPKEVYEKPKQNSQALNHIEKSSVKVFFIGEKAYWVSNNTFYCASTVGNAVDIETAAPVDTSDMSKKDIEKMLFILDNLKNGNSDDNSSAGNERF